MCAVLSFPRSVTTAEGKQLKLGYKMVEALTSSCIREDDVICACCELCNCRLRR